MYVNMYHNHFNINWRYWNNFKVCIFIMNVEKSEMTPMIEASIHVFSNVELWYFRKNDVKPCVNLICKSPHGEYQFT
jgi:hypothetical protein